MGRSPCCDHVKIEVKKGPWTPEEDKKLVHYIQEYGLGSWRNLPKNAGLNRCGKSCRLRWTNYLRPDIKRGKFTEEEEQIIIHLHSVLGNKWSSIATRLPGRTANEIKNYWNTHLKKKLLLMGIDPVTHRCRTDHLSLLSSLLTTVNLSNLASPSWDNSLRLQADAAYLAKLQIIQSLIQLMASNSSSFSSSSSPSIDLLTTLLSSSLSLGNNQQLGDVLLHGSLNLPNLSNIQQDYSEQEINNHESKPLNSFANNSTHSSVLDSPSTSNVLGASSNSSMSSNQFEAWEGLSNLDDDDTCWKDFIEQITTWPN